MVQRLKHTAYRLWFAVAGSGLASMGLLGLAGPSANPTVSLLTLGVCFGCLLWLGGWVADRVGLSLIRPMVAEAGVWERSGIPEEAEKRYHRALSVYDSFLVSPGARRRTLPALLGRMARFYLALPEGSRQAEAYALAYLALRPGDQAFAAAWLERVEASGEALDLPDAVLARIGDAHPGHAGIQEALARLCLSRHRTDFAALQAYRRLMQIRGGSPPDMAGRLARVFLDERRADEWALSAYLDAAGGGVDEDLLRGLAACSRWLTETPRLRSRLEAADRHLSHLSESERDRLAAGFAPPTSEAAAERPGASRLPNAPPVRLLQWAHRLAEAFGLRLRKALTLAASPVFAKAFRWTLVAAATVGTVALLINTAGYLVPRPPAPPPPEAPQTAAPAPPKPYTIQVAAYLKAEYAEQYADELRGRDLDATIVETRGGDKVWYQVRVSGFDTKQAAARYGESLKKQGIIEDFYVANRPLSP